MLEESPGEIITFYSYAGGTGRSAALANVACLLAARCREGRGVLMVDWSLEAPSLHHFFAGRCATRNEDAGLVDLLSEWNQRVPAGGAEADFAEVLRKRAAPADYEVATEVPGLSLLKAGRFDGDYSYLVSTFPWADLHGRAPWLLHELARDWVQRYRYVLIDAPAGVNELSGVCSMMLPHKLVGLFTPSRASLDGLLDVMRCAADYRRDSEAGCSLGIFPLPSKVDRGEPELRSTWRFGERVGGLDGYQARFEVFFRETHRLEECDLTDYFSAVQVPYVAKYAYGEEIASLQSTPEQSSFVRAYAHLADRLASACRPWEGFEQSVDVVEIDGRHLTVPEAETLCAQAVAQASGSGDWAAAARYLEALAQVKERTGNAEEAEKHYLEAIAIYRDHHPDQRGKVNAIAGLARLERLRGRLDRARMYYLDAARLHRADEALLALAETLRTLGDLESQLGESATAVERYQESSSLFLKENENLGAARAFESRGDLERKAGNLEQAEEAYREAVRLYRAERRLTGWVRALCSLGDVERRCGRPEEAEKHFLTAVDVSRRDSNPLGLAFALRGLAHVRHMLKKLDDSAGHYLEAIGLYRSEGELFGLATCLQSLGDVEVRLGKPTSAVNRYEEAMTLFRRVESHLGVANALRCLGDLERRSGKSDRARERYQEALALYRSENNNLGLANCLQSLGDLEKRLNQTAEAAGFYEQAIQIYRGERATLGLANSLKSLGDVESENGSLSLSESHYQQAIELYQSIGNHLGVANTLQSLGDLERAQKRYKESIGHYAAARNLYRTEKQNAGLAYTCSELARVSHALVDFIGSIQYMEEAVAAARAAGVPSVTEYVQSVQREILNGARVEVA